MSVTSEITALNERIKGIEKQKSSVIDKYKAQMKDFDDDLSKFRKARLALMVRNVIRGEN